MVFCKKKSRDISVDWIADGETNYLYVLFTANGYDAASFSSATGEFSPITTIGRHDVFFRVNRSVSSLNFISHHRLATIFICKQRFKFHVKYCNVNSKHGPQRPLLTLFARTVEKI